MGGWGRHAFTLNHLNPQPTPEPVEILRISAKNLHLAIRGSCTMVMTRILTYG